MFLLCSENITLDMEQRAPFAPPTRIAMWLAIVSPFAKVRDGWLTGTNSVLLLVASGHAVTGRLAHA